MSFLLDSPSAPYVPEYVKSFWIKLKAWCPFTLRALKDLPERLPNWVSSWLMTQSHKQYEVYILFLQLKVLPYYIDQIVNIRWITEIVWLRQTFDCVDHNKLWKILKEMGIQDHLNWLLCADQETIVRTGHGKTDWFQTGKGVCQGCMLSPAVKSLSCVRLFAIPWTAVYQASLSMGFSRQEYWRGLPFPSPSDLPDPRLNPGPLHCRQMLYPLSQSVCLYAEYIKWMAGLDEAWARIKIARRNINNLRYADNTTFMEESKEELKSLLMKVKE